jgi:fatty-acyl-CoA synthase
MALPLASRVEMAAVLARRGMLRPVRPDKLIRVGLALRRFGSTIATAYMANAITRPDQPAVVDDDRTLTYREIDLRTNSLARALAELGLGEGDRLGVLCRNGAPFVESVVACAKLGADVVPLNTSFSAAELAAVLERERPPIVVFDEEFAGHVEAAAPEAVQVVAGPPGQDLALERLALESSTAPLDPPAEEGRTIILTSGTTGAPKGARLGRPSGLDPLAWFLRVVPLNAGSPYLIPAPLFHAHGYGQLIIGSSLGCTMVLPRRFDPAGTLELIARHRVEALAVVPVMLKRIMDLPAEERRRHDTSSLRAVVSSGSALDPGLARAFMEHFGPVIHNLYGSTEVSWATIASPEDLLAAPGTVGRPPPGTQVAILDEEGRPLPEGEVGRIFVGSDLLFEGYTHGAETKDTAHGMMTPGDLGHLDDQGRLFVDAREDDMIVSGGENVYPGEVEEVLASHPGVDEVAVVGVEDEQFGQRLVAFVVPARGSGLAREEVDRFAREKLARFKVPRSIELCGELPRNALGKVLRRDLRDAAARL